jgi:hypothetical protein
MQAAEILIRGKILDSENKKPLYGATIRVVDETNGTYSSRDGSFKLLVSEKDRELKITFIGYQPKIVPIKSFKDKQLEVILDVSPVVKKEINVYGDYADNIVRQAIEKKKDNFKKKKTLSGILYSKINLEVDKEGLSGFGAGDGSITLSTGGSSDSGSAANKYFIMETISQYYRDFPKYISSTTILQRRQTRNIPSDENIVSITSFEDMTVDELKLPGVTLKTPLAADALSYYYYTVIKETVDDNRNVYILSFHPNSDLIPGFIGEMAIIDSTFDLIDIKFVPTRKTAIQFFDSLSYHEKYVEAEKNIWVPAFMEVTANLDINILSGVISISPKIKATSILNDIVVNKPLPDSVYLPTKQNTQVAKDADSSKPEFWDRHAQVELSDDEKAIFQKDLDREKEIYQKVDQAVTKQDSIKDKESRSIISQIFHIVSPKLYFNRVAALMPGLEAEKRVWLINTDGTGYYSFGQKRFFGDAGISIPYYNEKLTIKPYGTVFSKIGTMSSDNSYGLFVNSLLAGILHLDYYDYYRLDGYAAGCQFDYSRFYSSIEFENSRQMSLLKKTNRSIFTNDSLRNNPAIDEGNFNSLKASVSLNSSRSLKYDEFAYFLSIDGKYSKNETKSYRYRTLEGYGGIYFPLIYTGYNPIGIGFAARSGIADKNTPLQDIFRMRTRTFILPVDDGFTSVSVDKYGSNVYYEGHATLHLSDIWWRALGLPLIDNRGLELSIAATSGRYEASDKKPYQNTGKDYYSEIGFDLGRIPTFVSNIFYLSLSSRWGVGNLGAGNFGLTVNANLPF